MSRNKAMMWKKEIEYDRSCAWYRWEASNAEVVIEVQQLMRTEAAEISNALATLSTSTIFFGRKAIALCPQLILKILPHSRLFPGLSSSFGSWWEIFKSVNAPPRLISLLEKRHFIIIPGMFMVTHSFYMIWASMKKVTNPPDLNETTSNQFNLVEAHLLERTQEDIRSSIAYVIIARKL